MRAGTPFFDLLNLHPLPLKASTEITLPVSFPALRDR